MMKKGLLLIMLCAQLICGRSQVVTIHAPYFSSSFNLQTQCSGQVEWLIHPDDIGETKRNPSWRFLPDVPHIGAKARHDDYRKSGYDRGHMCPAEDRSKSVQMMHSTFVMSNVAPQISSMNRGTWKKTEMDCRKASGEFGTIHVLAIPVYLDRDTTYIGAHRVAVPHAFVKVAWVEKTDSVIYTWFLWNK